MDETALRVLRFLRKNSRASLAQIGRELSLPTSTVFDKVRLLERSYGARHTSIPRYEVFGYGVRLVVVGKKTATFTNNTHSNNVRRCKHSVIADMLFSSLNEAERFLGEYAEGILHHHYILETCGEERFLSE